MSVCTSVRSHIAETSCSDFTIFSVGCVLSVAVARSFSDDNASRMNHTCL